MTWKTIELRSIFCLLTSLLYLMSLHTVQAGKNSKQNPKQEQKKEKILYPAIPRKESKDSKAAIHLAAQLENQNIQDPKKQREAQIKELGERQDIANQHRNHAAALLEAVRNTPELEKQERYASVAQLYIKQARLLQTKIIEEIGRLGPMPPNS